MSKTVRGDKAVGYDFWSRRCFGHIGSGKISKTITKRKERHRNKKISRNALFDSNDFEMRFAGE